MDRHRPRMALGFRSSILLPFLLLSLRCSAQSHFTVSQRIAQFGDAARERMKPAFERAKVSYPPKRIALLGLKQERRLQLYAVNQLGKWVKILDYPILAASGTAGPKLREGDRQVPEGVYKISSLNPNSRFHVSLRVDYPNANDRQRATVDGRSNLGSDIMIHGSNRSIGCLAMGDTVAEELFTLAHDTKLENIVLVLAPHDYRVKKLIGTDPLQTEIQRRMNFFPR